ncbi:MAG: phosphotransferase [Micavibrio aeruginosavorus]|uniref:Phosphotransferase n=1 Tax=Micavibrio aeruginosavorus TaxID=349221 RepID=A0A7T5R1L2_9BACT|nr:MAG: phosphotransferase [Micavibrio aeruginosavorus]
MKEKLRKAGLFIELKRLCPAFARGGADVIGSGWGGLVIDHKDGTVSKAFLNHANPRVPAKNRKADRDYISIEAKNLELISGASLGGVLTPRLVEDPILFGHHQTPNFFGIVRMTRIKGEPLSWNDIMKTTTAEERKSHFEQAGELLARFHAHGKTIPRHKMHMPDASWATGFKTSQKFSDETNQLLVAAKEYYHKHAIPGFVHADYAGRNILRQGGKITGLLDFSFSGHMPSLLHDFRAVPQDDNMMDHFVAGYERAGGAPVDRVMTKVTEINDIAGWLDWMERREPEMYRDQWNSQHERLQEKLKGVKDALLP